MFRANIELLDRSIDTRDPENHRPNEMPHGSGPVLQSNRKSADEIFIANPAIHNTK